MAGAYAKTVWVDGGPPPISAANLNKIENQLAALSSDSVQSNVPATFTEGVIIRPPVTGATYLEMGRADAPVLIPDFLFSETDYQLYVRAIVLSEINDAANLNIRRANGGPAYNGPMTALGDGVVPGYVAWNAYDGTSFNLPDSNARIASVSARTKGARTRTNCGGELLFNTTNQNTVATKTVGDVAADTWPIRVLSTAGFRDPAITGNPYETLYLTNNPVRYTSLDATNFYGTAQHKVIVAATPQDVVPIDLDVLERVRLGHDGKMTLWTPTDTAGADVAAKDSLTVGRKSGGSALVGAGITVGNATLYWDAVGLASDHRMISLSATGGIGYGAGAGASQPQSGTKSTSVTLNRVTGKVTMITAAGTPLAANGIVYFTLLNSSAKAGDNVVVNVVGGNAAPATYRAWAEAIVDGSFIICLQNVSAGPLAEPVQLQFSIIRGAVA